MNSVRRSLVILLVLGAALIALVGTVGTISALNSARAVDKMVDDVRPAAVAARGMRVEAIMAESAMRAFALSSDSAELRRYRTAVEDLAEEAANLDHYVATHPERSGLRDAALASFDAWVDGYADPRIANGGGTQSYEEPLYRQGQRLFQTAVDDLDALSDAIEQEYAGLRSQINDQLRASVTLIVVSAVVGVVMLAVLGWWIVGSIQTPLASLAGTVRRLRDGDHDARAAVRGPTEVREVASAVNEFADESGRAREMEERVQQQLRDIDRARSEFVSNVSHELRTPLTIINGNLELLHDDMRDEATDVQDRMLSGARRNVARLSELIEDLLALNSAEHSGTALDLVDFRAVIAEVVGDMGIAAASRGLSLVKSPRSGKPIVVLGDANQLRRAVLNLVSNAVKFSHDGGEVRLEVSTDDTRVTLRVIDHGIGIPADDLDKVGGRFFRAANAVSGQVAGTGLGLRIVHTIVNNHHGTMTLTSEAGEGTVATIVLQLAGNEDAVSPDADSPRAAGEQSGPAAG